MTPGSRKMGKSCREQNRIATRVIEGADDGTINASFDDG
jgi:hypothetical protein